MKLLRTPIVVVAIALAIPCAAALSEEVSGHWKGRMEPGNHSAEIELDLQRAGSSWQAELLFRAGSEEASLPIEALHVDTDSVLVVTRIEGAEVTLELMLEDGLLLGSVRVMEDGRVHSEGPAGLARAEVASAQTRLLAWLDARGASIDPAVRDAAIERAMELFLAHYVFRDTAERAVADVRERLLRGEYSSVTSPARIAEMVGRQLAQATGDRHVNMKFSATPAPNPLADVAETPERLAQLRRDAEAGGFGIGPTRVLEGNVGYLEFRRFLRAELAGDAVAAAMQELADTDALIIDLRESRGGDPVMVVLAASWLFDGRPRHWNDMVRRVDGTTTQFWTAGWLPGRRYVEKPVYVLTAARTFSAPESFAYELQQTGRATIVGEATGGGAHTGAWFPVVDRFALFIPLSRYVSATSGGDWERSGVTPDVPCAAAEALDCAHRLAREELARRASGP